MPLTKEEEKEVRYPQGEMENATEAQVEAQVLLKALRCSLRRCMIAELSAWARACTLQ